MFLGSNIGSDLLLQYANTKTVDVGARDGQPTDAQVAEYAGVKRRVMEAVNRHFSPEFLNRLGMALLLHDCTSAFVLAAALRQRLCTCVVLQTAS